MKQILLLLATFAAEPELTIESIVPALSYGPGCSSAVELRNLGGHRVAVDVEGHKASGALVPLVGHAGITVYLNPGERGTYKLEIQEQTSGAWVRVREHQTGPSPVVAVAGSTECVVANQLRSAPREVAFPTRNPWFSSDIAEQPGSLLSLINTSEYTAKAAVCYSSGGLFSIPSETRASSELRPICSTAFEVQIPPFGSREFPAAVEGSSHFSLKTAGSAIVLEMLRPADANIKVFAVDSSIKFGSEVSK